MSESKEKQKIYIDRKTKTCWFEKGLDDEGKIFECAICSKSDEQYHHELCRGCGGMSEKYSRLFGSCGVPVVCPNCATLSGPDTSYLEQLGWNYEVVFIDVENWREHTAKKDGMWYIVFSPGDFDDFAHMRRSRKRKTTEIGGMTLITTEEWTKDFTEDEEAEQNVVESPEIDDEAEYREMREEEAAQQEYYGGKATYLGI